MSSDPSPVDCLGRSTAPPANQPPRRSDILTVAFPGFMASFGQVSKYTGPDPVVVLDKGSGAVVAAVRCRFSARIVHNVHPQADVDERRSGWSWNPVHMMTSMQAVLVRWFFRMPELPLVHNIPSLNNMGGWFDQAACRRNIEAAVRTLDASGSDQKLVLFGFSRGAATTLYTALRLPEALAARVGLVLLEAPFDTLEGVLADSSWFPRATLALFRTLGTYSGPEAYVMPDATHIACPFAFVTSDVDTRVPKRTTMRAITELRRRFPAIPCEHLELRSSRHACMAVGNNDDRASYVSFVESLYDRHLGPRPDAVADPAPYLREPSDGDDGPLCRNRSEA